jgi:hypothetical protein
MIGVLTGRELIIGGALMACAACLAAILLIRPHFGEMLNPGRMTAGHEAMACDKCHKPAEGTVRQQAQANVAHWLGFRETGASFGNRPVASEQCLDCHTRTKDRHPIHRFREPRFLDVVNKLDTRSCMSCHREHRGERVSIEGTECVHCHERLVMKNDPLDVSHENLVKQARWDTCLGCHDFHGNHVRDAQEKLDDRYELTRIRTYLEDGPSPYGEEMREEAKKP